MSLWQKIKIMGAVGLLALSSYGCKVAAEVTAESEIRDVKINSENTNNNITNNNFNPPQYIPTFFSGNPNQIDVEPPIVPTPLPNTPTIQKEPTLQKKLEEIFLAQNFELYEMVRIKEGYLVDFRAGGIKYHKHLENRLKEHFSYFTIIFPIKNEKIKIYQTLTTARDQDKQGLTYTEIDQNEFLEDFEEKYQDIEDIVRVLDSNMLYNKTADKENREFSFNLLLAVEKKILDYLKKNKDIVWQKCDKEYKIPNFVRTLEGYRITINENSEEYSVLIPADDSNKIIIIDENYQKKSEIELEKVFNHKDYELRIPIGPLKISLDRKKEGAMHLVDFLDIHLLDFSIKPADERVDYWYEFLTKFEENVRKYLQ